MANMFFKSNLFTSSQDMNKDVSMDWIRFDIQNTYREFCKELIELGKDLSEDQLEQLAQLVYEDLQARVEQDPIALSTDYIYRLSKSFNIIYCYRIAHLVYNLVGTPKEQMIAKFCAFRLSEEASRRTAIEIHPEAKIGKCFVIDHGINTLIGATSEIGDHCTLLQNVVLGARKITFNEKGKRHPTLGNNVHVSGGVRILGPVLVGSHSFIGPDCLIAHDVEPYSKVRMMRKQQIVQTKDNKRVRDKQYFSNRSV